MGLSIEDLTIGQVQAGHAIAWFLFGICTIQVNWYFRTFNDPTWMKTLVAGVWVLELIHQICLSHASYFILLTNRGNFSVISETPLPVSGNILLITSVILSYLVQAYYAWRHWIFTKRTLCIVVSGTLMTGRFGLGLFVSYKSTQAGSINELLREAKPFIVVIWILGAVVDCMVTGWMVYDLLFRYNRNFQRTRRLVERLVLLCVATGMLTAVTAIAIVICFYAMPHNAVWSSIYYFSSRLYAISILVSLNTRDASRELALKTGLSIKSHQPCIPFTNKSCGRSVEDININCSSSVTA